MGNTLGNDINYSLAKMSSMDNSCINTANNCKTKYETYRKIPTGDTIGSIPKTSGDNLVCNTEEKKEMCCDVTLKNQPINIIDPINSTPSSIIYKSYPIYGKLNNNGLYDLCPVELFSTCKKCDSTLNPDGTFNNKCSSDIFDPDIQKCYISYCSSKGYKVPLDSFNVCMSNNTTSMNLPQFKQCSLKCGESISSSNNNNFPIWGIILIIIGILIILIIIGSYVYKKRNKYKLLTF